MKVKVPSATGVLVGMVAFVSLTGLGAEATRLQTAPAAGGQARTTEQQVTVTGCIQREADYRKATGGGRGGAAGTGVGVANEFVLTSAAGTGAPAAAGTTGTAYELTGPNEAQAATLVGKRVQIAGKLKEGATDAAGATGGPTGGVVASTDLKLRELEVTSVRATTGTCPAN